MANVLGNCFKQLALKVKCVNDFILPMKSNDFETVVGELFLISGKYI